MFESFSKEIRLHNFLRACKKAKRSVIALIIRVEDQLNKFGALNMEEIGKKKKKKAKIFNCCWMH